jgi:hypothetical protein
MSYLINSGECNFLLKVKIFLRHRSRRTGKVTGQVDQCLWRIFREINLFSRLEYRVFYVSYKFVTNLQTLFLAKQRTVTTRMCLFLSRSSSSLSCDRSIAPSKLSSPKSAILSFLLQLPVSSCFLQVIQQLLTSPSSPSCPSNPGVGEKG